MTTGPKITTATSCDEVRQPLGGRPDWPKRLACLRCGRLRAATWAGDRMCRGCARANAEIEIGVAFDVTRGQWSPTDL